MTQSVEWFLLQTVGIYHTQDNCGDGAKTDRFIEKMLKIQQICIDDDPVSSLAEQHRLYNHTYFSFGPLEWTWTEEKGWTES